MQKLKIKKIAVSLFLIFTIFFLDQYSKHFMENFFYTNEFFKANGFVKITSFFNIIQVYNTGVSFGILNSSSKYFLLILNFSISLYLAFLIYKSENLRSSVLFASIIGAAFGNGFDRVTRIGVLDFLDFYFHGFHWPTFNVADIVICTAVFFIIVFDIYDNWNRPRSS